MGLLDHIERTSIANVVAGLVLIIASLYAAYTGDSAMLKDIALIAAGYLFGTTLRGVGGGK